MPLCDYMTQLKQYTLHSNNLYQIFAYVKNLAAKHSGTVSGMLLYAKTGEAVSPDCEYSMGGSWIRLLKRILEMDCTLPKGNYSDSQCMRKGAD